MVYGDDSLFLTCLPLDSSQSLHVQSSTFAADNLSHIQGWMYLMQARLASGSITGLSIVIRIFLPDKITFQNSRGQPATIPRKEIFHILIFSDQIIGFDEEETYQAQNIDSVTGNELEHEPGISYRGSIDLIQRFMIDSQTQPAKQQLDTFVKHIKSEVEKEDFGNNLGFDLGLKLDEFNDFDEIKADKKIDHEAFHQEIRDQWQVLPSIEQEEFKKQQTQFLTATSGKIIRQASFRRFKDERLTRVERIDKWNKLTLDERLPFLYHEFQVRKQRQKKKKNQRKQRNQQQ